MSPPHRRFATRTAAAITLGLGLALLLFTLPGSAASDNQGTIKVHNPNEFGEESNDPHVGCPFYVEGQNMEATSGTLVIDSWPPTGNMTVVVNTTWSANDVANDSFPDHHFLNGPYNLTAGHYKVFVSDTHHDKMKTFWVDCDPQCQEDCGSSSSTTTTAQSSTTTTTSDTNTTTTTSETNTTSETTTSSETNTTTSETNTTTSATPTTTSDTNTTTTEVPVFPTPTALGFGAGGATLGALWLVRRRL